MAISAELVNQLLGTGEFLQQDGLCQFKLHKPRRHMILLPNSMKLIRCCGVPDMQMGQVYRDRDHGQSIPDSISQEHADLPADIPVQFHNRPAVFHCFQERIRKNETSVFSHTSRQRLSPYDFTAEQIHLGLEIKTKPVFLHGTIGFAFRLILRGSPFPHGIIIQHCVGGKALFGCLARRVGVVNRLG